MANEFGEVTIPQLQLAPGWSRLSLQRLDD